MYRADQASPLVLPATDRAALKPTNPPKDTNRNQGSSPHSSGGRKEPHSSEGREEPPASGGRKEAPASGGVPRETNEANETQSSDSGELDLFGALSGSGENVPKSESQDGDLERMFERLRREDDTRPRRLPPLWERMRSVDWKKWGPVVVFVVSALVLLVCRPEIVLEDEPVRIVAGRVVSKKRLVWGKLFATSLLAAGVAAVGIYVWR